MAIPQESSTAELSAVRRRRRLKGESVVEGLVRLSGISAIIFVVLVFLFLAHEGIPAFLEVEAGNLLGTRWYPTVGRFGLLPLISGSLLVTIGAILISVPLGLAAAIFMHELAPPWLREILKPIIEILAGIPSVVLGFLGMIAVAPLLRERLNMPTGLSAFAGSLMLAYMALPTIISVSDDAIDAVPRSYRDASLALGANHWQTICRAVVPAARSGIIVAVMLGVGRAIGETMAVLMVTGNAATMPDGLAALFQPVRTMTATIAAEMGEVANGSVHYHVLFAVGIVLFLITFLVNLLASVLVLRRTGRRDQLLE
ncbi:MAG: phosphate ABC transporter permease subunit PstC [Anaerolineae bacterium]|nr:phosphate ABC transporter permease subunit PstC [Anaerolineae bacterium]